MPLTRRRFIALAASLVAGCSSTRIDAIWRGPATAALPVKGPVLVVGVTRDEALRRLYEDATVAALARRSVPGFASYRSVSGPLQAESGQQLVAAAREAGAAWVLSSAIVNGQLVENLGVPGPGRGFARWYGMYWPYVYGPNVQLDRRFVARTTLSDTTDETVLWAAHSSTRNLGSVEHELRDLADAIVNALHEDRLV
jgi:hypothetical protein